MNKRYFGAQHNLEQLIKKHVFVLCPNNSGSTVLSRALSECSMAWSLPAEGQRALGYAGPRTYAYSGKALLWAGSPELYRIFSDGKRYDWCQIRKAWYFQASAASSNASVFVQKTPANLLVTDQIAAAFQNTLFIIMVRNPYATIEGIVRRMPLGNLERNQKLRLATRHFLKCWQKQHENIARYKERSVFFSYESMCDNPEGVMEAIKRLIPELTDIELRRQREIKHTYNSPLKNFNNEQINRLTQIDLDNINEILIPQKGILDHFGYELKLAL